MNILKKLSILLFSLLFISCAGGDDRETDSSNPYIDEFSAQGFIQARQLVSLSDITDGDTYVFNEELRCRLYAVDTPESILSTKLSYDAITCNTSESDMQLAGIYSTGFVMDNLLKEGDTYAVSRLEGETYGRAICIVYPFDSNVSINESLVKEGYGFLWEKYLEGNKIDNNLIKFEQEAKDNKRGLWSIDENISNCFFDKK
jgi:endonuclease YncB( thermonuclease family)